MSSAVSAGTSTTTTTPAPARPVLVVVDPAVPSGPALRWAAREAAHRGAHLHVALPSDPRRSTTGRAAWSRAAALARSAAPQVVVAVEPSSTGRVPWPRRLLAASATADLLVLAAAAPVADQVVDAAYCPVVVVPNGPISTGGDLDPDLPGHPRDSAPVVLGCGPSTPLEAVDFAFAHAQRRGAGLLAVRTWHARGSDLGRITDAALLRWDTGHHRTRAELDEQLSACHVAYPEVVVRDLVVDDDPAALLAELAHRARLLVLGRSARAALFDHRGASPALVLTTGMPCPIAVVGPAAPARTPLLPHPHPPRRPDSDE